MTHLLAPAYGAGGTGGGGGGGGGSFTVDAVPAYVGGSAAVWGLPTVRTNSTLAVPDGGTAPYTYAWEGVVTTSGTWSIESPSAASTKFACADVVAQDPPISATFRCVVTDALGATGTSPNVEATVENFGGWGPAP